MMKLHGLVLSGGESKRMGRDKGALVYPHSRIDQRTRCVELLRPYCEEVFISCRRTQVPNLPQGLPYIVDAFDGRGPGAGILEAHKLHPEASWLVLACDFPFVDEAVIRRLIEGRNPAKAATCFLDERGICEPLLTIWEQAALQTLRARFTQGQFSPRETLEASDTELLFPDNPAALKNVNSTADFQKLFDRQ